MLRKTERVFDRGPGSIGMSLDEGRKTASAPPKPDDKVYVISKRRVDAGDGKPIPAGKFVKVRYDRVRGLAEVARREGGALIDMPPGWKPKDAE